MAFETVRDSRIRESLQRLEGLAAKGVAADDIRLQNGFEPDAFNDLEDILSLGILTPEQGTLLWFAGWLQRREEGEDHFDADDMDTNDGLGS